MATKITAALFLFLFSALTMLFCEGNNDLGKSTQRGTVTNTDTDCPDCRTRCPGCPPKPPRPEKTPRKSHKSCYGCPTICPGCPRKHLCPPGYPCRPRPPFPSCPFGASCKHFDAAYAPHAGNPFLF